MVLKSGPVKCLEAFAVRFLGAIPFFQRKRKKRRKSIAEYDAMAIVVLYSTDQ